jgi:hypothetical protein
LHRQLQNKVALRKIITKTLLAMKTTIKTLVTALVLAATVFTANAANIGGSKPIGFATGIYTNKSGKINVLVNKTNADAATKLLLRNEQGQIVYRETVGKNSQKFGRVLNLNELSAGKYELEISSNGESEFKKFQLSEQKTERTLSIQ